MLIRHTDSLELPNFLIVAVETTMRREKFWVYIVLTLIPEYVLLTWPTWGMVVNVPLFTKAPTALNRMPLRADSRDHGISAKTYSMNAEFEASYGRVHSALPLIW